MAGLGPNWSANSVVHTRVYLNLKELKVGKGAVLTLFQQYADNRVGAPVAVAALQIGQVNNGIGVRYQPVGGPVMPWVPAPASGFFRVDTSWNAPGDKVGLTINGQGYEERVELGGYPLPNRADFGMLAKQGSIGGKLCMDELIYDDQAITAAPFAVAADR